MRVTPGQAIAEHIDNFQADDIIRVHIPVVTHPLVEFWVEKELYKIPTEKLTYINVRRRHKVINKSKFTRIHLVIDVKWDEEFGKRFYEVMEDNL
jgi:aspartyl/asparaginyl beta-hydroxylase (cupin superfamily)